MSRAMSPSSTWAAMNSLQPERSQRNSSSAMSDLARLDHQLDFFQVLGPVAAQRGMNEHPALAVGRAADAEASGEDVGRRELGLRFDTTMTNDQDQ